MTAENQLQLPIPRNRNLADRQRVQTKIIQLRMDGETFEAIAYIVGLSERQTRRHYDEFIRKNNEQFFQNKKRLFGAILLQFESSLDNSSRQLRRAESENDPARILLWQKMRQECLRNYADFLRENGVFQIGQIEDVEGESPIDILIRGHQKSLLEKIRQPANDDITQ